jgi:hypothetical protein
VVANAQVLVRNGISSMPTNARPTKSGTRR